MKVQLIKDHPSEWECIEFPTFPKGTRIDEMDENEDRDFKGWHTCKMQGYETFVPISFVKDGKLTRDYNPTELIIKKGDIVEVIEIVNAWLLVKNEQGTTGWLPAECVVG